MSETTAPATPASTGVPAPASTPGMLDNFFTAIEAGASLVYHRVLAAETDLTQWTSGNPILGPLIDEGVTFASSLLTAHGVPVPAIVSAGEALMSALGSLAQSDPTVASGGAQPAPAAA